VCAERRRPFARRQRTRLDAGRAAAVVDLVTGLPELAVGHDVDARLALQRHHLADALLRQRLERCAVARLSRLHDGVAHGRIGQAARMGGEDSVCAALHGDSPLLALNTCAAILTETPPLAYGCIDGIVDCATLAPI
jgi:hypothetical protein